jgi:hypothetical protein
VARAVGAAILGAVFAARAGPRASEGGAHALHSDVIDGVQTVFLVAAPLAALALIVVLRLPELPLQTRAGAPGPTSAPAPAERPERPGVAAGRE